jgi:hypothetical protein
MGNRLWKVKKDAKNQQGLAAILPHPSPSVNDCGVFELGWPVQKFDFSEKSNFFALSPS